MAAPSALAFSSLAFSSLACFADCLLFLGMVLWVWTDESEALKIQNSKMFPGLPNRKPAKKYLKPPGRYSKKRSIMPDQNVHSKCWSGFIYGPLFIVPTWRL